MIKLNHFVVVFALNAMISFIIIPTYLAELSMVQISVVPASSLSI
jgi:uncharacterized membrane protein YccF (DUF307 family)